MDRAYSSKYMLLIILDGLKSILTELTEPTALALNPLNEPIAEVCSQFSWLLLY